MMRASTISPLLWCVLATWIATGAARAESGAILQARSFEPATTAAEAIELARRDAAEALLPRVRDVTRAKVKSGKSLRDPLGAGMPSDETLRAVIRAELAGESLVRDRRVDVQARPYGDVYSATLTIDTSTAGLHRMAHRAIDIRETSIRRTGIIATVAGIALAGIGFAYLAANSLTRGYYQGRLRLAAATTGLACAGIAAMIVYGIAA